MMDSSRPPYSKFGPAGNTDDGSVQGGVEGRRELFTKKDPRRGATSPFYTRVVRALRIILPLIALGLAVIVFTWSTMEDTVAPIPRERIVRENIGKNELLNPRFESQDRKNQPYTITAQRAFQTEDNADIIILDKPVADIGLKGGSWLAITAREGKFNQSAQELVLTGDVELYHDKGYTMTSARVRIDMDAQTATTDTSVRGHGPVGTLNANGMRGLGQQGRIIFTGPARAVLYESVIQP